MNRPVFRRLSVSRLAVSVSLALILIGVGGDMRTGRADEWADFPWTAPAFEEVSGSVAVEGRLFAHPAAFTGQERHSGALVASPEYYIEWDDYTSLTVAPFLRLDSGDAERTHADLRELFLRIVREDWELGLGVGKVFWGVAESRHLVDIINQTDQVENIDLEDKLGQPMVQLSLVRDWGFLNFFYLPYFRERTFQGRGGRLRNQLLVDDRQSSFTSGAEHWHPDVAMRYTNNFGDWDVGLAYFHGTGREPTLSLGISRGGAPVLVPEYELINQASLDVQYTTGAWLWKLETLFRQGQKNLRGEEENYYAMVGGFEYTLFGIFDSNADLGLLSEYLRDSRLKRSPDAFQNDLFVGARLALNDEPDTQVLFGVIQDLQHSTRLFSVEASRRLGQNWRLTAELRTFHSVESADVLSDLRDDDLLQIEFAYYY